MKEIIYDKLVRDKIPEITEKSGKQCKTEILSDEKYLEMIDKKLNEELAEYHEDQNIEELADLLEVIYAVTKARGYSIEDLEKVRAEKAEKRGGFDKKILLKLIEYKQDYFVNNLDMVGINHKLIVYLKTLSKYDCILWTSADEQRVVAIIKWLAIDNCFSWIFYSKKTNAEEDIERICKFFNCNRSDLCLFDNL